MSHAPAPPQACSPSRPEEAAFLQSIVDSPADKGLWLILADWLEEHDDPRRAELLRLHRRLLATWCQPEQHPERAGQQARLVQLLTKGVQPAVPRKTLTLARDVQMTLVWIAPGSFLMGSPRSEEGRHSNERQHRVTLTRGFWLAQTPVTQRQWRGVMGSNPSGYKGKELPVETVSWEDCQEFCRQLGEQVRQSFRLPTEAEWEYACRAGTTTPFFFGEALSTEQANYNGNYPYGQGARGVNRHRTTAPGSFPANAWGCTTCTATYGSGPPPGRARTRDTGAATGTTAPVTAGPRAVTGSARGTGATTWASASFRGSVAGRVEQASAEPETLAAERNRARASRGPHLGKAGGSPPRNTPTAAPSPPSGSGRTPGPRPAPR